MPEQDFKEVSPIEKIQIKLTDQQESELNAWISRHRDEIGMSRNPFLNRQKQYLAMFDDFITEITKGPWEGALNIKMPLTAMMVKSYHARLYTLFTSKDTVTLSPREPMDDNKTNIFSKLRQWYLWDYINEYRGLTSVLSEIFYDTVTVGYGIGMKSFDVVQRKYIDIVPQELEREMVDLSPQMEEAQKEGRKASVSPYKEVQKILTYFEGSKVISLPFENCYFPNDIPEMSNLDHPPCVIVTTEQSGSDLILKAKQGEYKEDRVKKILEKEGKSSHIYMGDEIKEQRAQLSGFDYYLTQYKADMYNMEYVFCRYDIDDDGICEELVITRSAGGTIVKITYLDRISKLGFRPLYKFDCFTKSRQSYSRGVPEYIFSIQNEMDMIHNMRLDYMQLQAMPWGVFKASSTLDTQPVPIAPGKFIPVDETTDVRTMTFHSSGLQLAQEEDRDWHMAERLVNVSPISQGIVPQQVGPTRSTSGVLTLLRQMDKEFQPIVEHNSVTWKKLEKSLMEDLDLRIDPMKKIRLLGSAVENANELFASTREEDVMKVYKVTSINNQFDIVINVADIIQTDEMKQNEASIIFQTFGTPSLMHQFGVATPQTLYKIAYDYLKAYKRDPKNYLNEPDFIAKPLTLYQEIQVCGQGEMPPMSMQDDHLIKAQAMGAFIQTPEFAEAMQKGLYRPDVIDFIQQAINKHMILAQALQPKGLPNQTGEQGLSYAEQLSGNAPQQRRTTEKTPPREERRPAAPEASKSGGVSSTGGASAET